MQLNKYIQKEAKKNFFFGFTFPLKSVLWLFIYNYYYFHWHSALIRSHALNLTLIKFNYKFLYKNKEKFGIALQKLFGSLFFDFTSLLLHLQCIARTRRCLVDIMVFPKTSGLKIQNSVTRWHYLKSFYVVKQFKSEQSSSPFQEKELTELL